MPDPITLLSPFAEGVPLSARLLNGPQVEILRQLYEHTHEAGLKGPQLQTDGYADTSVTEPKLADGATSLRTLADGAAGPGKLADGAVTARAIAHGAIGTGQIADNAATEANLDPNVRLKLNRIGGGVPSTSTVIWRDPIVVFVPPAGSPPLIETFYQPAWVYWIPTMIGLREHDRPFRLTPKVFQQGGQDVLDPYDIFDAGKLEVGEPRLAQIVSDQIVFAGQEIGLVGAFAAQGVTGFRADGVAVPADGGEVRFSQPTGLAAGEAEAARLLASTGGARSLPTDAIMAAVRSSGQPQALGCLSRGLSIIGGVPGGGPRSLASQPAPVKITESGQQAAIRRTTVGVVEADGGAVPPGTEDAFTVSSGFPGKKIFSGAGPAIDFRNVGNDADRKRAATVAAETLYNQGIDSDFVG